MNATITAVEPLSSRIFVRSSVWLALASLLLASFIALGFGSSEVSPLEVLPSLWRLLTGAPPTAEDAWIWTVLTQLRAPRVLAAAACGAALSVAGALSQGLFRNALASPTVLGGEAGGCLAAALAYQLLGASLSWFVMPMAAFVGALAASALVLALAARQPTAGGGTLDAGMASLLLAGFALNALLSAATSWILAVALTEPQRAGVLLNWLMGGFAAKGWEHVGVLLVPLVVGLAMVPLLAVRLDLLSMGAATAESLGVDVRRLRFSTLAVSALLVGTAVSVGGALPFVSLVVPHGARLISGPGHRRLLVNSALYGASLVVLADFAARMVRAPQETPLGALTALLGAPFFLALLLRRKEARS